MRRDLPAGTVTFLFTDVEGSTKLLHELGADEYAKAVAEHRRIVREALGVHGGVEVDTQGDAFFVAFPTATEAVAAATEAQQHLGAGPIRVRMGLHTGEAVITEEGYIGIEVHLGARIAGAGHGGQVLLSKATRDAIDQAVPVRDLGEHRVKDFAEPVWIFQLGDGRFPPLKTISNTNLPSPASSFVGRELEVIEVASLLRDGARLVTLTGPGGSGKTRLAIEAAAALVPEFKNGVFWVDLAALRDPALVTETVSQTLGAKDGLADLVGARETLLLLDNFEQVVEAAPALSDVLEACPNLKVLVTSREVLRVRGEVEYAVPPLADPEAVKLFCARAQLQPEETIAELCRRLDNLPLGIELAAARTSVLSPAKILERLAERLDLLKGGRDAGDRQQTLRSTIAWSHDLLTEGERRVFARLSVFRGGCTLEAAEEVAAADLHTIQLLVDKSLFRHREDRFWMLETIRGYATERLDESGEADELKAHHAQHFLVLAEEAHPHLRGSTSKEWLRRLEGEHDNLRAAMDEFEAMSESQLVLRLAGALWPFWYIKGHLAEAGRRLEGALLADERPTAARARALLGATVITLWRGDVSTARLRGGEALELHQQLGDALGTAYSIFLLGHVAKEVPDWPTAKQLFDQSLRAFRELGEEYYILLATDLLALACYKLGDRERAWTLAEDNLRRARATGNDDMEPTALGALGLYAIADGRIQDALPLLEESTRIWRDRGEGDLDEVGLNLCSFARAAAIAGRAEIAVRLVSAATSLNEEIGATESSYVTDLNEGTLAMTRRQLDEAAFAETWEQGRKLTFDEAIALALGEVKD